MSQIAINSSQNVNINFNIASIGERLAAWFIDMVIKGAYTFIIFYFLLQFTNIERYLSNLDPWSATAIIFIITFPAQIYTLVCESMMEGQTFGKKLLKIKVVKIDGFQAGFGDYLMRWFFRLIDIGIVGLITMIVSKNTQRLGDMASGAAVITLKNKVNISHTILENLNDDYIPTFAQVIQLSDNDVRIIKENFVKAIQTDDRAVISKLSNKIQAILKMERDASKMNERQFISIIIKDYNFYTGKDI